MTVLANGKINVMKIKNWVSNDRAGLMVSLEPVRHFV